MEGVIMQSFNVQETVTAWSPLAETLFVPHTEDEYNRLVATLDELVDEVGEDETHPVASLMEILGALIEHYEESYVPELKA
jgi:HTH-type transcriptional regulator / antitoxin HigA